MLELGLVTSKRSPQQLSRPGHGTEADRPFPQRATVGSVCSAWRARQVSGVNCSPLPYEGSCYGPSVNERVGPCSHKTLLTQRDGGPALPIRGIEQDP